jgi:hypothetical protein
MKSKPEIVFLAATSIAVAFAVVALFWPVQAICQSDGAKVDTGGLYPKDREAFEECAPRLSAEEQQEFISLPPMLRGEWLKYHCSDLRARFEACKPNLSDEQQQEFMQLDNDERGAWLDENCGKTPEPEETPGAEESTVPEGIPEPPEWGDGPDDRIVVELTPRQQKVFKNCKNPLSKEQKIDLAYTPSEKRYEWLKLHCDDIYVFAKCSPGLTVDEQKAFLSVGPVARGEWLMAHCESTLAGETVKPVEDPASEKKDNRAILRALRFLMPSYEKCRSGLYNNQRLEFMKLAVNRRYEWLYENCRAEAKSLIQSSKSLPSAWNIASASNTQQRRSYSPESHGWPTSRVVAHATFWPGLVVAAGGVAAAVILGGKFPLYWVPELVAGGIPMIVGIAAASIYSKEKSGKSARLLLPEHRRVAWSLSPVVNRQGRGLMLTCGRFF